MTNDNRTTSITVRMSTGELAMAHELASAQDLTVAQLVRKLIAAQHREVAGKKGAA